MDDTSGPRFNFDSTYSREEFISVTNSILSGIPPTDSLHATLTEWVRWANTKPNHFRFGFHFETDGMVHAHAEGIVIKPQSSNS